MITRMRTVRPDSRLRALLFAAFAVLANMMAVGECPAQRLEGSLRVVVVSDINGSYGTTSYTPELHRVMRLIREEWRPDLVLAAGDLVAGQKASLEDEQRRAMWRAFDSSIALPLRDAGIPFGFTLGNHDASPSFSRDREIAVEYWRESLHTPRLAFVDSGHFPLYYSFVQGGVFFLAWDASHAGAASDGPMLEWVRRQLGSKQARAAAHRIVIGHLPLYAVAVGRNTPGNILARPDSLVALFERNNVALYISGHHHAYYPGRRGNVRLLACGALGQGPRPLLGASSPPMRTVSILDITMDSIACRTFALPSKRSEPLREIPLDELPPHVDGVTGRVDRWDLP
jgi:hypothetical protein